ncbi:hypothetical protein POM88_006687 [Heracleum sosnowskyi]|uniref:NUA/TPR/MLP1-2-like domain-containing protein n=1 Tax=Heracleum sosnowskyi TaxID=360622 RepID=A0AAD8J4Q5_9APIA|nr:hypothetical protein POM88_006687 [Heracleum sosnowskyi]
MLILVVWHENEFNNDLDGDAMIISAYQITAESDAQRVISERLDMNGLVEQNTQLRSLVRRLSNQTENREAELKVPSNLCHYSLVIVNLIRSKECRQASTGKLRVKNNGLVEIPCKDHEVSHTHSNKGVVAGTVSAVLVAGAIGVGAGIWFWKKVRAKTLVTHGVQRNENRLF